MFCLVNSNYNYLLINGYTLGLFSAYLAQPPVVFISLFNDTNIFEEANVAVIGCTTDEIIHSFIWRKDNAIVNESRTFAMTSTFTASNLTILYFSGSQAGNYTCEVDDQTGITISNTITLQEESKFLIKSNVVLVEHLHFSFSYMFFKYFKINSLFTNNDHNFSFSFGFSNVLISILVLIWFFKFTNF